MIQEPSKGLEILIMSTKKKQKPRRKNILFMKLLQIPKNIIE
jgi:hypothetical protein